ncbi:MAG: hypothetical protein ACRCZ9_04060 [Fusobacteriaceae bacterium]
MELKYTELYRCDICSEVFRDFKKFEKHFNENHANDKSELIKRLMNKLEKEILNNDMYVFTHSAVSVFNDLSDIFGLDLEEYAKFCKENDLKNLLEGVNIVNSRYDVEDEERSKCDNIVFELERESR